MLRGLNSVPIDGTPVTAGAKGLNSVHVDETPVTAGAVTAH